MRRRVFGNQELRPPKTEQVELSDKKVVLRVVICAIMLLIAAVAFAFAVNQLLAFDEGYCEIEYAGGNVSESCADEFTLVCYCKSKDEHNKLTQVYSELSEHAYKVFSVDEAYVSLSGLSSLNAHPNETVTLDPLIYDSLELLEEYNNRAIFLAPVYYFYSNLYTAENDAVAVQNDPYFNEELKKDIDSFIAFINSKEHIKIELLGEQKAKLTVSDEYAAFMSDFGMTAYADFFWMKNAFIADYISNELYQKGYSNGSLSSFDGFSRTFGDESRFALELFDLADNGVIYPAAKCAYSGKLSSVAYYQYPLGSINDQFRFYRYNDGALRSPYIDMSDGLCKGAYSELICASSEKSCAEIMLRTYNPFVADSADKPALDALGAEGYIYIIIENDNIYMNQNNILSIEDFFSNGVRTYKMK